MTDRISTPASRFEIGNDTDGVIEFMRDKGSAFGSARRRAKDTAIVHYIFDRMARRGQPELWAVFPNGRMHIKRFKPREDTA